MTILCALLFVLVHGCAATSSDVVKHELRDLMEYNTFPWIGSLV